ncbi:MAG: UDP-glucose/GDP-mannose dehydrogenase family protein [Thermoplasmata archaeon]|nr:UDP-glucose/GDP-mannose dehydrogenase family protein [Thermoplasmata archaeon]
MGILGLGYMGLATAAAFARHGVTTVGYDVLPDRRAAVRAGMSPFHEDGLEELLQTEVRSGRLTVAETMADVAERAAVIFLCLPTPPRDDGEIDLRPIEGGAAELGRALARVDGFRVVVVKSTVVPGTTETVVGPALLGASGKTGDQIAVASNPEFLAEGRMVEDALHPDRIVVGVSHPRAAELLRSLYAVFDSPLIVVTPAGAEMTKYASNSFLALKISFANELARFAEQVGVNVDDVVRGVGSDPRIGHRFLQAGPGFGGSCFSKDVQAFARAARDRGVRLSLVEQIMTVNDAQTRHAGDLIAGQLPEGKGTVALLGLAFKEGTDDLRESRALPIVERLAGAGIEVRAHDPVSSGKFATWLQGRPVDIRDRVRICAAAEETVTGADVAALQVPWPEYLSWPSAWTRAMRHPVLVDLRRAFSEDRAAAEHLRLVRLGDGRPGVGTVPPASSGSARQGAPDAGVPRPALRAARSEGTG